MINETSSLQPSTYEPVPTQEDTMGQSDHRPSPEGRAGDAIAFKTALVSNTVATCHSGPQVDTTDSLIMIY